MPNIRVATFDGPGEPPVIREVPKRGAAQGCAHPHRGLRESAAPTSTSSRATGPGRSPGRSPSATSGGVVEEIGRS